MPLLVAVLPAARQSAAGARSHSPRHGLRCQVARPSAVGVPAGPTPRHLPAPRLGRAARPADRLPHARRPQRGRRSSHFVAATGPSSVVPAGAKLLTRVGDAADRRRPRRRAGRSAIQPRFDSDPALAGVTVFETTALTRDPTATTSCASTPGTTRVCCLAAGATEACLYRAAPARPAPRRHARRASRRATTCCSRRCCSPVTGLPADADPTPSPGRADRSRCETTADEAFTAAVPNGALTPRLNPADPSLPLQRVRWREEDALTFAFCLSADVGRRRADRPGRRRPRQHRACRPWPHRRDVDTATARR